MKTIMKTMGAVALAATCLTASGAAAQDPGPAAYANALEGKRIVMIPMAMGFDLAQGWAGYLAQEIPNFGGTFETRDPNWSVEAGAQAITEAIAADPKPDVLIVMPPDLNSYSKLMRRAQKAGIYVFLIDNPANFKADAFFGGDWTDMGRIEAREAMRACGEDSSKQIGLVQGDQTNATSLFQYAGIVEEIAKFPDFKIVAKPDSNWDATRSRNVTTTMLQQHPDICAIIDFWDGDAIGAAAAIRELGMSDKVHLIANGGGEQTADCDMINSGGYGAVVSTSVRRESYDMLAMMKYLFQNDIKPGDTSAYIYTETETINSDNITSASCWSLKEFASAN